MLRPHQTIEEMAAGYQPGMITFAALSADQTVISTASVRVEQCPWFTQRPDSWRLRGMATEPTLQGTGLGTAVLNAALAHVALGGGGLVWCNARTPALAFYRRAGFVVHGNEWQDPQIGPHVCMWREVVEPLD